LSVGLLAFLAAGCVSRAEIEEIKKNQEKILAKLDQMGRAPGGPAAQQAPRGPDPAKVYSVPVADEPAKGSKNAWVTVVEWSDFQCPFCSRVVPTIKQMIDTYGDDVRIVFKHNPLGFHQRAKPAAMAAECAHEQGKFWQMHDVLFENNRALEDANLDEYAKKIGLDMGRFKSCYTSNKHAARIDAQQREGMTLGARGTPAFFINGKFLSGAQPFERFKEVIDAELKVAKDSGLSKSEYYAKAVVEKGAKSL
jgi:protein-disulfide isomerase